jgi:HK97 family phage major capsid protein
MYKPGSNPAIKQAVDAMNTAMASGDNDAALAAFEQFGQAVADTVREEFQSANGDNAVLAQRGFRVLTASETKFYEKVIEAGKAKTVQTMNGLLTPEVMPQTIIEDVYKHLIEEHPLLDKINFVSVQYLTSWILNDHTVNTAVWGEVNDEITKQITSAFRTVKMAENKLSAFAVIEKDMLDLGPVFLDGYIRTFLQEALATALEKAIISGTGHNQPIGMDRDIHQGVSVNTSTGYPRKTAVKIKSFTPKDYGEILAKLAETEVWYTNNTSGEITAATTAANEDGSAKDGYTKHGGRTRVFDQVTLICNQKDYLEKIMPATTVITAAGTYATNLFPFPTDVVRSAEMATGEALLVLPEEYFAGLGSSKEGILEFSDEFKFTQDQRVFKIKLYGNGKAYDNSVAILLDISELEAAYVMIKAVDVNVTTQAASS